MKKLFLAIPIISMAFVAGAVALPLTQKNTREC